MAVAAANVEDGTLGWQLSGESGKDLIRGPVSSGRRLGRYGGERAARRSGTALMEILEILLTPRECVHAVYIEYV